MAIRFVEIKAADSAEALNSEWVILENVGKAPFNTRGCGMTVGRRGSAKKSLLGIIDPGFVLAPGEHVRMLTGNPATQAHGALPEDGVKNYSLFLPKTYVAGPGTVLTLVLRGLPVAKAEFDPAVPRGIAPKPDKGEKLATLTKPGKTEQPAEAGSADAAATTSEADQPG